MKKTLSERIHEMLSEHNANVEKTFYYTEKEVKELCRMANKANLPSDSIFDVWFDRVKKK